MDKLGPHRAAMMATLPSAMQAAAQQAQASARGQEDLFGVLTVEDDARPDFVDEPQWSEKVWLEGEKETLGLYLTGHPVNRYLKEFKNYTSGRLVDIRPTGRGKTSTVAGLVLSTRVMMTKRGSKMGIIQLDDRSARLDVMFFTDAFETYQELLEKDRMLVIQGEVSVDDFSGGIKMTAREVMDLSMARERWMKKLRLTMCSERLDELFWQRFYEVLEPYRAGTCPIAISYQGDNASGMLSLGTDWRITPSEELIEALTQLLGQQQVTLEFN
jgi:DNA polymerase-3 subunit alpha